MNLDLKEQNHMSYLESLDNSIMSIQDQFDQQDFRIYKNFEHLLLKSILAEDIQSIGPGVSILWGGH